MIKESNVMSEKLSTKNFWNRLWKSGEGKDNPVFIIKDKDIPFSRILKKYIPKSNSRAIEIGCFPCSFLTYICKNFGYFPEGIDFVEDRKNICSKILEKNGLKKYKIYNEDFLKWKSKKKYGLVSSFGFIEHFKNPEKIVKKHIDLLEKNGKLIIEVPNFSGLRYLIAKNTDSENLARHNLEVMNLGFYKKIAEKYNLKIDYLGYYGRFEYTWLNYNPSIFQKLFYYPFKIISKFTFDYPFKNKFLSGWIIFIAEKK